jgi:hypothetical protein
MPADLGDLLVFAVLFDGGLVGLLFLLAWLERPPARQQVVDLRPDRRQTRGVAPAYVERREERPRISA